MDASKKGRVGLDLTEGPILSLLFKFALPIIAANVLQQVYSMVDLMVIGKFVGSVGTVAVSTGSEIMDYLTPVAVAISTAAQIYLAQLTGAKDKENIKKAIGTLITVVCVMAVVFTVVPIAIRKPLLRLINCPEEAFSEAGIYLTITTCGMPFIFGYNAVCGILRGMGESKRPFIFILVAAIVNVFMDLLLVAVFHLDAAGTAIATALSQVGSFVAALIYMLKHKDAFGLEFSWRFLKVDRAALKAIVKMSIPQIVRTAAVHGSMFWVKAQINVYGMTASATYSIGNKVERLLNMFIYGVDAAAGGMMGQNIGARKHDRVKQIILKTLYVNLALACICSALFLLVPRFLYSFFTDDPAVIEYGVTYFRIMVVGFFVVALSSSFKSISTGAGAAGLSLAIGIIDGIGRVAICLFVSKVFDIGCTAYFWGAAFCQLIPGIIAFFYFTSGKWKTKKLLSEG